MTRRRLDAELVRRGLARSRQEASDLVAFGRVRVGGIVAHKVATQVVDSAPIVVADADQSPDFASRGAHKLLGALRVFAKQGLTVAHRRCLDAGASTGGFTDVLLIEGAREVIAVDVGYGQLVWRLQNDPRVVVRDRTNVRELNVEVTNGLVDLVVADLSFISLRLVIPALQRVTSDSADLLLMVKPQFEVGKEQLPSGGVVRDPASRREAVSSVAESALQHGLGTRGVTASPLPGPAGNVEYFLWVQREAPPLNPAELDRAIEEGPT